MSLLEDIFLQDEANEAQQLERVIEGDEFEERLRSDSDENSEKEDEAEEEKRRVDPTATKTKRVVRNPRFILNPARLTGPRGIQVIPEHFKDFKFKGKGHEKEDLDLVLKKLEHWAYRLYPKFQFSDCLKKIETLGKKRPVMVHLHKIRSDQYVTEETVVQRDSSDDEEAAAAPPEDEFDRLLQQQIELARSTPAPSSVRKLDRSAENGIFDNPKATSSPSISEDQRERMLRSRRIAEEKRLARLKQGSAGDNVSSNVSIDITHSEAIAGNGISNIETAVEDSVRSKKNRSHIIDSSDEEDITVVETVTIEIHNDSNRSNTRNAETKENDNVFDNSVDENIEIELDSRQREGDSENSSNEARISEVVSNESDINKDGNSEHDKSCSTETDEVRDDIMAEPLRESSLSQTENNINTDMTDKNCKDTDKLVNGIDINSNSTIDVLSDKKGDNDIGDNEILNGGHSEKEAIPKPTNSDSEKVGQDNVVNVEDDLMDVDFSDDF